MQAQPPQAPNAFINPTPIPQNLQLQKINDDPSVWAITVSQPCGVFLVLLTREAAMQLSDQLRDQCGGLTIARDLPPNANGQHGGPA